MLPRFFRLHRNKFFAILFASLGLAAFVGYIIISGIGSGWAILSSPGTIISALLTLVIFSMLLVTNIQNDNAAFNAIAMFVFMVAWDMIWSLLPFNSSYSIILALSGDTGVKAIGIVAVISCALCAGAGIAFFIYLYRYRLGRVEFRKCNLWAWLFLAAVTLESIIEFVTLLLVFGPSGENGALLALYVLPEVFMGISSLFTLQRLRRI